MKHKFLKNTVPISQEKRLHYIEQSVRAVWDSFGELYETLRAKYFSVKAGDIEIYLYVKGLIEIYQQYRGSYLLSFR